MHPDISEILMSEEQIAARVADLGRRLDDDYRGRRVHLIGILTGAVVFLSDLVRRLTVETTFDFMAVSSYGGSAATSGVVRFVKDLNEDIAGRDVVVVEDIVDTGLTLQYLLGSLWSRGPSSLRVAVLLDKPSRRQVQVPLDYVGFTIPDHFVVGYGLDYAGRYRQFPYVGILRPEVYRG
jgi:hypoxanthine phosphoribosyltransferase